MKKNIFIFLVLFAFANVVQANGEELRADINFTRDSTFWGQGPSEPNTQLYDNRVFPGGFLVHGQFGRFTSVLWPYNANNTEERFKFSHRLSRAAANQFVFPKYSDIGRITIHFYNVSNTYAGYLPLQKNVAADEEPASWTDFDPKIEFYIPVNGGSTNTFVIDTFLNLGATQLRFAPIRNPHITATNIPNVQIYSIQIFEKSVNVNVNQHKIEEMQLKVSDKSLKIINTEINYKASIYNLAGIQIGIIRNGQSYDFQCPGHYLVKVETAEESITRKIVIH